MRKAAVGGLHLDVTSGPLLGQRFAADLARQLNGAGRSLLEAERSEGLGAALAIAERAVNGYPLVVDKAERLLVDPISLDDPTTALWQEDITLLRDWLVSRLSRSPTFLVSRR